MNRLSNRTILAIALAAVWPIAPAMAAAGQELAARNGLPDDEPPLRLAMSYTMTAPQNAPQPLPAPAPGPVQAAYPLLDPRDAMARRMRLEYALHASPDVDPVRSPPTLVASTAQGRAAAAAPERAPATAQVSLSREQLRALMEALRARLEQTSSDGTLAALPSSGQADMVVGMPAPLPLWPAKFYPVSSRSRPIYLPAAPEEPASRAPVAPRGTVDRPPPTVESYDGVRSATDRRRSRGRSASRVPRDPKAGPVLRGRAWRLANQGYRAYDRGRYEQALTRADEALRLRPDVVRLHLLRIYALDKLGRRDEALRAAEQAKAKGLDSPELTAAVTNLSPPPGVPTTEAYRKGFPIATQAYEQYNAGKYAEAAKTAEEAVRTDPTQGPWVLLWLNALENDQRFDEAIQAGNEALELGAPNRDEIVARARLARQAIANQYALKAYEALTKNKPLDAVQSAREAVRLAPDVASHQLLLIGALQSAQDLPAAEQAATAALDADPENTAVQLLRAYLRQQLGRSEAAQQDIDTVLAQDWIDDSQRRDTRLIGADLALAAANPERVKELLAPLPADDAQAAQRRQAAARIGGWGAADKLDVAAYAPLQLCRDTPYGTVCEVHPWDAPGTDNPAARAYAAYGQKRYADAIALARRAVAEQPDNAANQNLLTIALAAGTPAERKEALERLDVALKATPEDAALLRQRAYLYLAEDQPSLALQDFVAARSTGQAPPTNILDEAYAMAATGNRPAAAAMLRQAIDDADAGKLPLDAQQRFDTRSAVANFSREWGATVSVGYRGARSASNGLVGQPVSVPGDSVFSTAEVYWRPPEFLNSTTSTFDVYGRISNTLRSGTDRTGQQVVQNPCGGGTITVGDSTFQGASGLPTTTGAIGARYTPSTAANFTFGLERQFLLGSATRSGSLNPASDDVRCQLNNQAAAVNYESSRGTGGWQAYMLYGFYDGTALRLDTTSWYTMEGYLQAGYTLLDTPVRYTVRSATGEILASDRGRLKRGQGFAAGEVRVGRSILSSYSDRLVIFPHVSVGADWYSTRNRASGVPLAGSDSFDLAGNGRSWSMGAGPGVNFRYWLAGDRYNAQRSHVDLSLQYRANVGGGDASRSKGVFMNLSYSY